MATRPMRSSPSEGAAGLAARGLCTLCTRACFSRRRASLHEHAHASLTLARCSVCVHSSCGCSSHEPQAAYGKHMNYINALCGSLLGSLLQSSPSTAASFRTSPHSLLDASSIILGSAAGPPQVGLVICKRIFRSLRRAGLAAGSSSGAQDLSTCKRAWSAGPIWRSAVGVNTLYCFR